MNKKKFIIVATVPMMIFFFLRNDLGISMIDPECVMEIKTDILTEDDFIFKIINLPTSRFSKYCRGIIMLNFNN